MDELQKANNDTHYKNINIKPMVLASVLIILLAWFLAVGLSAMDETSGRSVPETTTKRPSVKTDQARETPKAPGDSETLSQTDQPINVRKQSSGAFQAPLAVTDKPHAAPPPLDHQTAAGAHVQNKKAFSPASPTTVSNKPDSAEPHAPTTARQPDIRIHRRPGVTFVEAAIKPIAYELEERFWGWRPNDIINFTDNVNNYQLGVLEVTRRTVVQLAERISRTGSTDAFNPHLENAMNWLMITATRYWFPSPESKYKESLEELAAYKDKLMDNKASFYTRTDNLIPLLAAFEDLMGSCDENLVKEKEKDGSSVSYFKVDDYFYYAKGVAGAMATILEAVHHDFGPTIEGRHGSELLHHAIVSCKKAASLNPWLITDGDLDGVLANHRANMAAPISHARFYLGQLIKTLST